MRIFLDSSFKTVPTDQLRSALESIFQQLEDQINGATAVASLTDTDQKIPEGIRTGDLIFNLQRGELRIGIFDGKVVQYASFGSFVGGITDEQHGARAGGNLHETATVNTDGFMSASDKVKSNHYKGDTSAAGIASLTQFPADGDWGFHTDTVGLTYSIAKNKSGTIFKVALA